MISPDTELFIYEVKGRIESVISDSPATFIGLWNEDDFTYLFFTEPQDEFVESLTTSAGLSVSDRHQMKYCEWQTGVPAGGFVVRNLRFVAPGCGDVMPGDLILDPTVVFGDGAHPTTKSCLEFISELAETQVIDSVLDLGTGSGILSLAAAKLGAVKITAVDRNLLAAQTARDNVRLNGYEDVIHVHVGEARLFVHEHYDLVAANLPFSVLRELLTWRDASLHSTWVVSGVNSEQGKLLEQLLLEQDYVITREKLDHPWLSFVAEKR